MTLASAAPLAAALACIAMGCRSEPTTVETHAPAAAARATETPSPTALQLAPERVARIVLERPGGDVIVLERTSDGWTVPTTTPTPANSTAVDAMTAVLAEVEIVRAVAATPQPEHGLGASSAIAVEVQADDGTARRFTVGARGRDETYLQLPGGDTVLAARGRFRRFFDLRPEQVRDPAITAVDLGDVERVVYRNSFAELTLVPAAGEAGAFVEETPSIQNFHRARASKNVAVVAGLNAQGFVDAPATAAERSATGLYEPDTARVSIQLRGRAEPLVVWIGRRAPGRRLHVRTSESDQVYLVSAHLASSLVPRLQHFERSDAEMRELATQQAARDQAAKADDGAAPAAPHDHGAPLPTRVPPAMLRELRQLARDQAP